MNGTFFVTQLTDGATIKNIIILYVCQSQEIVNRSVFINKKETLFETEKALMFIYLLSLCSIKIAYIYMYIFKG